MRFNFIIKDHKINVGSDYNRRRLQDWLNKNEGSRGMIEALLPESRKQRKFYHAAVIPLWAYLNGYDYRDHEILAWLHEEAKREFNGEMVILDGKAKIKGKSTRGQLNDYVEKVVTYLEENYAIDRFQVLEPNDFKKWRDEIYPAGGPDCYLDYLKELGRLPSVSRESLVS